MAYPGAEGTYLTWINNRGDITGIWFDDASNSHGFLLRDGVFTTIDGILGLFDVREDQVRRHQGGRVTISVSACRTRRRGRSG